MTGIICAMDVEAKNILEGMTDVTTETIGTVTYTKGRKNNEDVVIAVCGIGKVFAAICTQTMILMYKPDRIINVGVAGALDPELKVCDIVVSTKVVQHDMDTSALGDPVGLISGINVVYMDADKELADKLSKVCDECGINSKQGIIASGDQFICSKDAKQVIIDRFNAAACEMEGASVGHVCFVNKVPFVILRAISDGADNSIHLEYEEFKEIAARNSAKVIERFFA